MVILCCAFILTFLGSFSACSQLSSIDENPPDLVESTQTTPTFSPERTPFPTEEIVHGTVSIRHSWDESQIPTLAAIIKSFQAYYPDVYFDVLYIPADSLKDRFISETNESLGPSVLLGPAEWGPEFYQNGLISNLNSDFDDSVLKTLNQPALGTVSSEDALIGLPYSISGVVLFRNKDIITIEPNTFDDLINLAQTATQGKDIGAYLERSFFYAGGHLNGIGGQLIDDNNLPGFNNGKGVAWLELLKEFELAGPTNYFTDDDLDRFKLGSVGWIIDGTWNLRSLADTIGPDKLVIDPWPDYEGGRLSGYVMSENVYLSSKVEDPDRHAAVKFIQFLVAPEAQTQIAGMGRIPASLRVNPSDPTYGLIIGEAIQALSMGTTYPVSPDMTIYNLQLDVALRNYYTQDLPPDQVLQNAQDAILSELAKSTPAP
jgi:ABC-type glycerol-3-phosphate transport system substrate-binding protein